MKRRKKTNQVGNHTAHLPGCSHPTQARHLRRTLAGGQHLLNGRQHRSKSGQSDWQCLCRWCRGQTRVMAQTVTGKLRSGLRFTLGTMAMVPVHAGPRSLGMSPNKLLPPTKKIWSRHIVCGQDIDVKFVHFDFGVVPRHRLNIISESHKDTWSVTLSGQPTAQK